MNPIRWSDAARDLFALTAPTAVSAGAGSGKTTCLVELCVRLMEGAATGTACEPRSLVAITFTEKAAAELEDRLRSAVAARASQASPGSDEARDWIARLHALDGMAIGTIHGFARRLLREHALAADVDPDLEVLDEELAGAWRREAATAAVLAALDRREPEPQLLVAAHGGAGATGLAGVVCELVRERATLGEDRPLRPTPDAAEAVRTARAALLACSDELLARADGVTTGSGRRSIEQLRVAVAQLTPADRTGDLGPEALPRFAALGSALRGWRIGKGEARAVIALKEELAGRCDELLAVAAEVLATPQATALCALVADAERRYRERKRAARAADFDDLLLAARDLLRRPDGPRGELRRSVRALLVDEYQDVNRVQQEIFELIADPDDPSGPLLVAVGDLKQSIYRFRGADVSVFRGLTERFERTRRGRVLRLTENHRSTAAVLELVNEVSLRAMQPAGGDARDYELAFGDADRLVAARTDGARPACEILDDVEQGPAPERRRREAVAIAARIRAMLSGAAGIGVPERSADGALRRPTAGDVAILFRRLTEVSAYEQALREAGIPCRVARGGGFYQAPEVRDLGELAATLADPEDLLAWAAVLRSPLCAIGDGALVTVGRLGFPALARRDPAEIASSVVAADPAAGAEGERLRCFLEVWRELCARRDRVPIAALLAHAIERLDLEAVHRLAGEDGERRVANVRKVVALAERLDGRGLRVGDFARRLRMLAALPPREPEADLEDTDSVALLSVHQAKGLEWPIVFVPDLGSAPLRDNRRAMLDRGALAVTFFDAATGEHWTTRALQQARKEAARASAAESRRLLYVALTRARDRLVLSGEAGRAGATWRDLVERALADRPTLATRVALGDAGSARTGTFDGSRVDGPRAVGRAAPAATAGGPAPVLRLASPSPPSVRIAVTRLADHARCPRRAMLREAGVTERGPGIGSIQDDPDRATARGTLAHALLAEIDLGAPPLERRAQMSAAIMRRGYDPAAAGVRKIVADVIRFLDHPAGRALAAAARTGRLRREVPFLLRVGDDAPAPCYLDGAIDALVEEDGRMAVIDFKYALPSAGAVERYRFQLVAYAAAVAKATGRPVTASLQFLRGDRRAVDVTPRAPELRSFVRDAARLARAAHAGDGRSASPGELGRTVERCRAEGCGFVERCYR